MCWWLDFIWGTGGLGSLGDPLDPGLQQGWKAKQLRLHCAGVHMCAWGCGVPSSVLILIPPGCAGMGVGGGLLCATFLRLRSSDFFLIHFIYFCKVALISYIPQSPYPALTFFVAHA